MAELSVVIVVRTIVPTVTDLKSKDVVAIPKWSQHCMYTHVSVEFADGSFKARRIEAHQASYMQNICTR